MIRIGLQTFPMILLLYLATITPFLLQPANAISGCERCAQTGDCSLAFHSGPGQYCGQWLDYSTNHKRPCCCPYDSVCKLSSTSCRCHIPPSSNSGVNYPTDNYYPSPSPPTHKTPSSPSYSNNSNSHYKRHTKPDIIDMLGFAIALTLFTCCCCLCIPKFIRGIKRALGGGGEHDIPYTPYDDYDHYNPPPAVNPDYYGGVPSNVTSATPVVRPVSAVPSYGATTVVAPAAPVSSGGGGVGGNILSAVGGLAAGTVLGNMIAHRMDRNDSAGDRNVAVTSGGYDIVGDTGNDDDIGGRMFGRGDVGTGGGFDIPGDDGGGGGDFGGDFDGDS